MAISQDSEMIELWLQRQASAHTRGCYRRDAERVLSYSTKSLKDITLGDLQGFAQSLVDAGLAPISRARTLAAIKSLFGFCQRMSYIARSPAAELVLPSYEIRLAERIVGEPEVQRLLETAVGPATACSWRCCTPLACGCRKPAGCFGGTYANGASPDKSRCLGRTGGPAQLL